MYRFAMINLVKLHRELKFKNIPLTMNNVLQLLTFPGILVLGSCLKHCGSCGLLACLEVGEGVVLIVIN